MYGGTVHQGSGTPLFRPTVAVELPTRMAVAPWADDVEVAARGRLLLLRIAQLDTPDGWDGDPATLLDRYAVPEDLGLRELAAVDVDDVAQLAAFTARWGLRPRPVDLLRLGVDAVPAGVQAGRRAARRARVPAGDDVIVAEVAELRGQLHLARGVVDVARAFLDADDPGQAQEAAEAAWRGSGAGGDGWWGDSWEAALRGGLSGVRVAAVSAAAGRDGASPVVVDGLQAVMVQAARYIAEGTRIQRCRNERAHGRDGGWFTAQRTTRRSHGTAHAVGVGFCSDRCRKADQERRRRARQRAEREGQR